MDRGQSHPPFPCSLVLSHPSSPSPSPSCRSIACPGPRTTFLPPLLCSSLSMTDGDVAPAGALAAPIRKPNAQAFPGPRHCPLQARTTTAHAPGQTLAGVSSMWGPVSGCPGAGMDAALLCFIRDTNFLPLSRSNRHPSHLLYFCPLDQGMVGCVPRVGRVPMVLVESPSLPAEADSERKQKLLSLSGHGAKPSRTKRVILNLT